MPVCVMICFDRYSGPTYNNSGSVPIVPIQARWISKELKNSFKNSKSLCYDLNLLIQSEMVNKASRGRFMFYSLSSQAQEYYESINFIDNQNSSINNQNNSIGNQNKKNTITKL